jgi:hypothetical protein
MSLTWIKKKPTIVGATPKMSFALLFIAQMLIMTSSSENGRSKG